MWTYSHFSQTIGALVAVSPADSPLIAKTVPTFRRRASSVAGNSNDDYILGIGRDILTSTKLKPTKCNAHVRKCYLCEGVDCMRKNFCYQLTCTECSQTYVGESGRFYRNRMWEHFKSVKGCNRDTAMGGHYQESHAEIETPEVPFEPGPFFFHGFLRPISRAREIENDAFHGHFTG